jgi:hypothetical protein
MIAGLEAEDVARSRPKLTVNFEREKHKYEDQIER